MLFRWSRSFMEHDASASPTWQCHPVGEAAVLLEGQPVSLLTNRSVVALAAALEATTTPGIYSLVPGISSLLVRFDPLTISAAGVEELLDGLLRDLELGSEAQGLVVTIPVHYGGTAGPDLEAVAAHTGLSPREIVALHCGAVYRVLVIGFAPGFPYIGPLPPELTVPRHATPRPTVPAGSVAVAAGLTGIYPTRLPGGWQIIGRTTLQLFDPYAQRPAILAAGDRVRFEPLAQGIVP